MRQFPHAKQSQVHSENQRAPAGAVHLPLTVADDYGRLIHTSEPMSENELRVKAAQVGDAGRGHFSAHRSRPEAFGVVTGRT